MKTKKINRQANIGSIPTFSINSDQEKMKSKQVLSIAAQMQAGKKYSPDYVYMLIDQVLSKGIDISDITSYSKQCERFADLKRMTRKEEGLISDEEYMAGFKGNITEQLSSKEDIEDWIEVECIVEDFINKRATIYFADGIDVFRLLELALQEDAKAERRLEEVKKDYPDFGIILYEALKTKGTIIRLFELLA